MRSGPWLSPATRGILQLSLQVILSLALFAVLQLLAARHNVRFDLTPTKEFVLSEQARQVAATLTQPIRITAFFNSQQGGQRREMLDLLEQFRVASPHIDYRLLDLDRSPGMATKFGVSSYNTGVLESDGRVLSLQAIDEGDITNALLKVSRKRTKTLCFLIGHGERSPLNNDDRAGYSEVAKALERENFQVLTVDTIGINGVPAECTVLIAAGPSHDFLPGEADHLAEYIRRGGKVLLLVDPDAPPSVLAFLRRFGLEAGSDLLVDDRNRFFGADSFMPRIPIFDERTFGNGLEAAAVFSLARTIRPLDEQPTGMRVAPIAMTSPESWAYVDGGAAPDENVRFRKGQDRPGPLTVGAMATLESTTGDESAQSAGESAQSSPGRLVAFGDSDFGTNFYLNLLGNRDLFMSTVAVLTEDPELIAVRRKGLTRGTMSPISLTAFQGRLIFWVAVIAQPLAFILAGCVVALTRRRQKGGR